MKLLENKIAIITGASRGIGKAIAEIFSKQGAKIVITSRSAEVLRIAAALSTPDNQVTAIQGDITQEKTIKELIKLTKKLHGKLDILVNNAGILEQSILGMIATESLEKMFSVNIISMINLTQYAVRLMGNNSASSIINLASIAGTKGIEGISAYAATKGGVISFTQAAAKELAPRQIRVNAIAPGFIETDMTKQLSQEWYAKRVEGILMGRIGSPEDIANCALFLASDLSSYITGQVIGVDGGMKV
jgi:3-oxoacyl-[acyl-carrier protein] reductase